MLFYINLTDLYKIGLRFKPEISKKYIKKYGNIGNIYKMLKLYLINEIESYNNDYDLLIFYDKN